MNKHYQSYIESANDDHLQLLKSLYSDDSQDQRKSNIELTLNSGDDKPSPCFPIGLLFNQELTGSCGVSSSGIELLTKINSTVTDLSGSQFLAEDEQSYH
jgi:hypothetical protein